MSHPLGPYPLSARATYELMHFEIWSTNMLIERLDLPYRPIQLPPALDVVCGRTGWGIRVSTDPAFKEDVIRCLEQAMAEEDRKSGDA